VVILPPIEDTENGKTPKSSDKNFEVRPHLE
jgi:hypothetical protein